MKRKKLIGAILIIAGIAAIIVSAAFAFKTIAEEDWHGKIGDTKTIQLPASECPQPGSGECYKILTCAPEAPKCACDVEGDWH